MKYNIYLVTKEERKLMRKNVNAEVVRKFMENLSSLEKRFIELERIKEEKGNEK